MPETYLRFGELIFVGWRYRGETGAPGCVKKATRILCRLCPLFFFFLSFRYKDTTPRHRKQCFSLGFSSIFEKKKKKKKNLLFACDFNDLPVFSFSYLYAQPPPWCGTEWYWLSRERERKGKFTGKLVKNIFARLLFFFYYFYYHSLTIPRKKKMAGQNTFMAVSFSFSNNHKKICLFQTLARSSFFFFLFFTRGGGGGQNGQRVKP